MGREVSIRNKDLTGHVAWGVVWVALAEGAGRDGPQTSTRMPYRPSGAAAAGPKAATARSAAMAKSRIEVVSKRARAVLGRGRTRWPFAQPGVATNRGWVAR